MCVRKPVRWNVIVMTYGINNHRSDQKHTRVIISRESFIFPLRAFTCRTGSARRTSETEFSDDPGEIREVSRTQRQINQFDNSPNLFNSNERISYTRYRRVVRRALLSAPAPHFQIDSALRSVRRAKPSPRKNKHFFWERKKSRCAGRKVFHSRTIVTVRTSAGDEPTGRTRNLFSQLSRFSGDTSCPYKWSTDIRSSHVISLCETQTCDARCLVRDE